MKNVRFICRLVLCVAFFAFVQHNVFAQDKGLKDSVYVAVDVMPDYPGGKQEMLKYISKNTRYPKSAVALNIQGRVFVSFVVRMDGSIGYVKIVKGIGGGCDEEAAKVISEMPNWNPGYQGGRPVNVRYTIPINFSLDRNQGFPTEVLLLIDAKEISESEKRNMSEWIPKLSIADVTYLEPKEGEKEYGEKGKNGVVIVTTKK
ncbi:MAG: energy transducer TonB [Verrucomicrobia bacterium]|nr:energy transducer TonB [Cytophagales bacterium]